MKSLFFGIFCAATLIAAFWPFQTNAGAEEASVLSIEDMARKKLHHAPDKTFVNPWLNGETRGFWDLFKWQFASKNPYKEEKKIPVKFNVVKPDFAALEKTGADYAVWLGHSTVLIKANGVRMLTDPVFGDVNFLLKRKTPFPIKPTELPKIDFVLIFHSHYEHMNSDSIALLKGLFDPYFVTGPGYEQWFKDIGTKKHIALDWWESYDAGGVKITSLPAQHWSKRTFFDTNTMLWCSFMIEHKNGKYFWAGDTGYFRGFKEFGEKFGPIDAAFLPVGSYEPRWFMSLMHINPEEAVLAAKDLRARTLIPIHWGTFDLTDEPLTLPIKRLREIHSGASNPRLLILEHGGSAELGRE